MNVGNTISYDVVPLYKERGTKYQSKRIDPHQCHGNVPRSLIPIQRQCACCIF